MPMEDTYGIQSRIGSIIVVERWYCCRGSPVFSDRNIHIVLNNSYNSLRTERKALYPDLSSEYISSMTRDNKYICSVLERQSLFLKMFSVRDFSYSENDKSLSPQCSHTVLLRIAFKTAVEVRNRCFVFRLISNCNTSCTALLPISECIIRFNIFHISITCFFL